MPTVTVHWTTLCSFGNRFVYFFFSKSDPNSKSLPSFFSLSFAYNMPVNNGYKLNVHKTFTSCVNGDAITKEGISFLFEGKWVWMSLNVNYHWK